MFYRIGSLLVAVLAVFFLAAPAQEARKIEQSPHAAALEVVFKTQQARIREVDPGNWWHDVKERQWTVRRPIYPGWIDSTHLFRVGYRIDGKEVAAWMVDTYKGKAEEVGKKARPPATPR
jgi:hypothetical protein